MPTYIPPLLLILCPSCLVGWGGGGCDLIPLRTGCRDGAASLACRTASHGMAGVLHMHVGRCTTYVHIHVGRCTTYVHIHVGRCTTYVHIHVGRCTTYVHKHVAPKGWSSGCGPY